MSKNKENIKFNTLEKILLITSLTIFSLLAVLVITKNIQWFDNLVYEGISKIICKPMTSFFKAITLLCETETILILLALILIFMKKKKVASYIVINTGLCVLVNQIAKRIFRRARPIGIALIKQGGFSFPSGHSMVALAFYGYIIYLIRKSKLSNMQKNISTVILSAIIILVGISRIYLGVHFASDVLAAYCLSTAFLVIIMYIERKKKSL
jgi:undecaprenyl-diphosphatase